MTVLLCVMQRIVWRAFYVEKSLEIDHSMTVRPIIPSAL